MWPSLRVSHGFIITIRCCIYRWCFLDAQLCTMPVKETASFYHPSLV